MKNILKSIILMLVLLTVALVLFSCAEANPYDVYDADGYTVSVKYDANGGMFHTNVEVIVDAYKLDELPVGSSGKKELALLSPDSELRGKGNSFTVSNAGYFLAGWYRERIPVTNDAGEALDIDGGLVAETGKAPAYTYSGRHDFENGIIELDPSKSYSSHEPITLYAAWIPEFKFEFYSMQTGALIDSYLFDPNYISEIKLPTWNTETGKLNMEKFPSVAEMTLDGVFLDAEGKNAVTGETVAHTGQYDKDSATAASPVMKLYLNYVEGERFRIYTAKQLIDNAGARGYYEICADLDFEGLAWPSSFMHGIFRGYINGNGHILKNITIEQTDTKKQNVGMFGTLSADAELKNIVFENVVFKIANGTISQEVSMGLFAGTLDGAAKLEALTFKSSKLMINSAANIMDNTSIGLLCGTGDVGAVDISGITAELYGDDAAAFKLKIDGNEVKVESAQ